MYTPLYVKTNYSLLSSLITIDNLLNYLKEHNYSQIAITDNNMFGVMEFYKKCNNNGIKPIVGLEINLENDSLLLYAKDYNGYKSLIKLSTIQASRKVEIKDIEKYNDSVICIVPYESMNTYSVLLNIIPDLYLGYSNKDRKSVV